jgi:cytochrome c oxidase cbb3-type subunit 2
MRRVSAPVGYLCLATLLCAQAADDAQVRAGRDVYLAEGCINCHSQYVRPATADVERWGPGRPLAESLAQTPPLFGNRRQGPDLQNVGNRRSPEWQRLHLMAPRSITPGSRMPSYAYLFTDGDPRGGALVAYLNSLGADTAPASERWTAPAADRPGHPPPEQLFTRWCASCHGASGRGDGPLAAQLALPPRNLAGEQWHYVAAGVDATAERAALARLIKYGVRGTSMAGREYLSDADVMALTTYVQSLHSLREKIPAQP